MNVRALGLAAGVVWGGALFCTSLLHLLFGYGEGFLVLMASMYPGYDPAMGLPGLLLGTVYGFVDGLIAGLVFAWLYNRFAAK